jgi:hypothetical protein
VKLGEIKREVLCCARNITPILKEVADFYFFGARGFGLQTPDGFVGNTKFTDIRRAEVQGIRDAIAHLHSLDDDREVKDRDIGRTILLSVLKNLQNGDKYYNFGVEQVIELIEQYDAKIPKACNDLDWKIIFVGEQELVVPSKEMRKDSVFHEERKISWRVSSFMEQIKKILVKDKPIFSDYYFVKIHHSDIMRNFEVSKSDSMVLLHEKFLSFLAAFYPGLRFEGVTFKSSVFPPLLFYIYTSKDVVCLFLDNDRQNETWLFLFPMSEYAQKYKVVYCNLIQRYVHFLEGTKRSNLYAHLIFFIERKYLQCCIPPDAIRGYSEGGVTLFYSREMDIFFQCLKEEDPYYRITILPGEYLSELFKGNYSIVKKREEE